MSAQKAPIRNGLRDITLGELLEQPAILLDTLQEKLEGLPVSARKYGEFSLQLDDTVRLLRAITSRSYTDLSLLALVDLLHAVNYFLVLEDDTPDSQLDGYQDDAQAFAEVFTAHKEELDKFRAWHRRQL